VRHKTARAAICAAGDSSYGKQQRRAETLNSEKRVDVDYSPVAMPECAGRRLSEVASHHKEVVAREW